MNKRSLRVNASKNLILITLAYVGFLFVTGASQTIIAQESVTLERTNVFGGVNAASFSPDGTKISLVGGGGVKIVSASDGKKICDFNTPAKSFNLLSAPFSPDGKMLAFSYSLYNPKIKHSHLKLILLDASNCREIKALFDSIAIDGKYISFSSDGRYLAAVADTARVWEVKTGREVDKISFPEGYFTQSTLISPDGKWFAAFASIFKAPETFGSFIVTDLESRQPREFDEKIIKAFRFSADSTLLITATAVAGPSGFEESVKVKVYEVGSWKVIQEFEVAGRHINTFDVSRDKQLLAIGGFGTFKIFSLKTGKLLAEQYHYKRSRQADLAGALDLISILDYIEFSPGGNLLATGGEDGSVKLWKLKFGK